MKQGWDWKWLSAAVTTSWLWSHGWGEVAWTCVNFSNQDCECLHPYTHITASGLVQSLTMSIMNDETRLRLEMIVCSGHYKLTLESWVGRSGLNMCQLFKPRLWVFTSIHPYHSIWTGPISHNEYNEWWNKAEIGNDCLQRSLQADFGVMGGEK